MVIQLGRQMAPKYSRVGYSQPELDRVPDLITNELGHAIYLDINSYVIEVYTTVKSYTWVAPSGVESVFYLEVGGSGIGGDGHQDPTPGGNAVANTGSGGGGGSPSGGNGSSGIVILKYPLPKL